MDDYLKISVQEFKDGIIYYQVVNQRYRCKDFFSGRNYFVSKTANKLKLVSMLFPHFTNLKNSVCFLGKTIDKDGRIIKCTLVEYLEILEAVKEYNDARKTEEEETEKIKQFWKNNLSETELKFFVN